MAMGRHLVEKRSQRRPNLQLPQPLHPLLTVLVLALAVVLVLVLALVPTRRHCPTRVTCTSLPHLTGSWMTR